MANLFQKAGRNIRKTSAVIMFWFVFLAMAVSSLVLIVEDMSSTFYGVFDLQVNFGMEPVVYQVTYYVLAAAPVIFQMGFGYFALTDESSGWEKWGKWFAVTAFFLFDFLTDLEHRSNGTLSTVLRDFTQLQTGDVANRLAMSAGLTFFFFTVLAESSFVLAGGMLIELYADFRIQFAELVADIKAANIKARDKVNDAKVKAQTERPTQQPRPQRERGQRQA